MLDPPTGTQIRANQLALGDVFAFTGANTHGGSETFTGNLAATVGQNQLGAYLINNCIQVEGVKYAFTDVGVNAAIAAAIASGTNCVKLGMNAAGQLYVFSNTVTVAAGTQGGAGNPGVMFTFDMTNAVIHCEFTGTCIRAGEATVEHSHIHFVGGLIVRTSSGSYIHDFSPCSTCPSNSTTSTGVEWLNVNGGDWSGGFSITGFRNALYLRASNSHSTFYNVFRPEYLQDNLIDYLVQPDAAGASVNDNFVIGGEAQKATDSYDFSVATNGGFGGNCIVLQSTGAAGTFAAQANVFDTSCESAVVTAARKPEQAVYVDGGGNDFRIYAEGFGKNSWLVDNACDVSCPGTPADNQWNRWTSKSGGGPIIGLSSFKDTATNVLQYIFGQRGFFYAGGNGCSQGYQVSCAAGTQPLFTLREVNGTNKDFSIVDFNNAERYLIDASGNVTQNGSITLGGNLKQLVSGSILWSTTAPTIAAAGCGGAAASIVVANGTGAFKINVGTTPTSACTITMPAATTGWNVTCNDITTQSASVFVQKQTGAESQTSVTITNFNTSAAATAFVASDILKCTAAAD